MAHAKSSPVSRSWISKVLCSDHCIVFRWTTHSCWLCDYSGTNMQAAERCGGACQQTECRRGGRAQLAPRVAFFSERRGDKKCSRSDRSYLPLNGDPNERLLSIWGLTWVSMQMSQNPRMQVQPALAARVQIQMLPWVHRSERWQRYGLGLLRWASIEEEERSVPEEVHRWCWTSSTCWITEFRQWCAWHLLRPSPLLFLFLVWVGFAHCLKPSS